MSAPSHIRVERDGAVGLLLMDRPERFNALDVRMAQDLRAAGLKLARDPAVRAVIFRGTGGKCFCAGAERPGAVILDTGFGRRMLAEPEGELLPRIC